ncbi:MULTISPECIES: MFS transporter [unclassified Legionella]|uniref:MFS transporter n=1 Tax=unclassified Legionella TaxID=2622702 RepID=UPI001E4955CF|nr:MFS transporter [Legionella sp. 31fI33]MCC5015192.1 MFS transporter [Legionella sp. 31fI33]
MILYVLILSLAIVIFNLTLPMMAGLYIVSDLGGNAYLAPYGVSFFCLGNVLGVPLGKPWVTRLSAIHLYVLCLCLMIVFSWQCVIASNYFNFILFRFLEGFASGPLFLLITMSLLPLLAPEKKTEFVMPLVLTCFAITPVLGACWGGWVAFNYHWQALFVPNIPICLFLIVYVGYGFRKFHRPPEKVLFDKVGYFFYSTSLFFIGTALILGQELDWFRSSLITFMLIAGGIGFLYFILRSLSFPHPIVEFRLFKHLYFCFALLNVALLFSAYFGMVILLSLWLKLYVNYTPDWIILLIGTMALGAWIPIFLNYKRFDARIPLATALLFFAISCFYTATFNVEINFGRIAVSRLLAGLGLALFLPPLFRMSVTIYPQAQAAERINVFHIVRLLGSALGASLYVILWQRRQVFYHERLGSLLTPLAPPTQQFFERAEHFHLSGEKALAKLNALLDRQATALALDDCFYLMGWMMVILLLLVILSFVFRPYLPFAKERKREESPSLGAADTSPV